MRHGRLLGFEEPFFHRVADVVVDLMETTYPELTDKRAYLSRTILHEEERFIRTLDRGLQLLETEVNELGESGGTVLPGSVVFRLYDTFGFPVDLTADIVRDRGISIDEAGFESEMQVQRETARKAWKGSGAEAVGEVYRELREEGVASDFSGYETLESHSPVLALIAEGQRADEIEEGQRAEVVLAETPFYGESGGQVGDSGSLSGEGFHLRVETALKPFADLIVLRGTVTRGILKVGDEALARVEAGARFAVAQNHSATHLLQAALRETLGDHVKQAGSLVGPGRLRFDFTHFTPLTPEEIREVERRVNDWVQQNFPVDVTEESFDAAVSQGATALFGEKYADTVRVVRMGDVSGELCGGTHAARTGDIGLFKILSEGGVAAGVRRIEAATGSRAVAHLHEVEARLERVAELTKGSPEDAPDRVRWLLDRVRELEREMTSLRAQLAGGGARDALAGLREVNGIKVLATRVPAQDPKSLREFADGLRDRMGSGVLALGAEAEGKALLLVVVTKDLTDRLKAGDLIRPVAEAVGGRGGGRPDLAQAGGPDPAKLDQALGSFYDVVESKL
jgi:alanyl-tRNA synthetase